MQSRQLSYPGNKVQFMQMQFLEKGVMWMTLKRSKTIGTYPFIQMAMSGYIYAPSDTISFSTSSSYIMYMDSIFSLFLLENNTLNNDCKVSTPNKNTSSVFITNDDISKLPSNKGDNQYWEQPCHCHAIKLCFHNTLTVRAETNSRGRRETSEQKYQKRENTAILACW